MGVFSPPVWTGFLKFSFLQFNSVEALIRLVVVQFSFVRRFVFHVFGDIQLKKLKKKKKIRRRKVLNATGTFYNATGTYKVAPL